MTIITPPEQCAHCPHLGLETDPQTHYVIADELHFCHQVSPTQPVNLDYQTRYCLTPDFALCSGYVMGWDRHLPRDVQRKSQHKWDGLQKALRILAVLLVLIIFGALIYIASVTLPDPVAGHSLLTTRTTTPTDTPTPSLTPSMTPLPSHTPTITRTPTQTLTPTPSPTGFYTSTPGPFLETPFGTRQCLVHQVAEGDTIERLSVRYKTTKDVLDAINTAQITPLWIGAYLVICPNQTEVTDLPSFSTQMLSQRILVSDLAAQTGIPESDIIAWNNVETDWLEAGRWVILPQP